MNNEMKRDFTAVVDEWLDELLVAEAKIAEDYLSWFDMENRIAITESFSHGFYKNPLDFEGMSVKPMFLKDSKSDYMFAPSSSVLLFGEPGTGKSFLLETAIAEHFGIMVDVERSPMALAPRLRAMGYERESHGRYVFPESKKEILEYVEVWKGSSPTIIGFDAFAGLISLWGGDTNSDQSVQEIFQDVFHPLRNAGHCVVIADHVPKNSKNKNFAIGSQNKKAQVDLALYIEGNGESGTITLTKDRDFVYGPRGVLTGQVYGFLEITQNPVRARVVRLETVLEVRDLPALKSMNLLERRKIILQSLQEKGPLNKTAMKNLVGGNTTAFDNALDSLVADGSVVLDTGDKAKALKCKVLISLKDHIEENFAPNDPGSEYIEE